MSEMIGVTIDSVRVSLTSTQRIVILHEADGDRFLPIWIGPYETESITIALQEIEVSRPQTHDLIKSLFSILDARLIQVEIINLKDDVFFGKLVIESGEKKLELDSRPSDALAMAARCNVPIYVAAEILESAGIYPDPDIRSSVKEIEGIPAGDTPVEPGGEKEGSERLSVFENFIEKLDLDEHLDSDEKKTPDDTNPKPGAKKKPK